MLFLQYLKSGGLKHSYCLSHFLGLSYRGLSLLIDGDIASNPGPTQNDCKSPGGCPKKIKVFKGIPNDTKCFFQYNTTSQLTQ